MTDTTAGLVDRMKGAALLDVATYEAVEHDESATTQAAIVVGIVAVAQTIGSIGQSGAGAFALLFTAVLGWLLWAAITYLIGDKLLGGTASWGELLRTIGFAQSPGVLYVLGIIPFLGGLVRFAVAIWVLIAGIIAIRQALDFSTGKAVLTAVLGWLALIIPMMLVGGIIATMS
jgi:hypothetical protein